MARGRSQVADPRPRPRRAAAGRLLAAALATMLLAAGCADVPTSGLLQHTALPAGNGGEQQGTACCGYIMSAPKPGWSPVQIVLNFILASADFADHHAIARQYLTPSASASWQPGPGPGVTVIAQPPTVTFYRRPYASQNTSVVQIGAQELGKVTTSGQYIPAAGGRAQLTQEFSLQLVNRQWRIATLPSDAVSQPSHELLLTKDLFQLAYQPRDLYYFDPAGKNLVPDPVFVPVASADPATDLVNALLASPQGWLTGAVLSAFPPAAGLRRAVAVPPGSRTAIVDLSLPAAAATPSNLAQMSAQLVWTLTSSSYGSAAAQAVKLEVNGRAWVPPGTSSAVQDRSDYPQQALVPPGYEHLYFLGANGAARMVPGRGSASIPVPGQAGTGRTPLTGIAISPDERYLAGIAEAPDAGTVYTGDLSAAAKPHAGSSARALRVRLTGVKISAASWDRSDNLWVAGTAGGQPRIWMLPGGGGGPVPVGLPAGTGLITALQVAPDGVRIAMITRSGSDTHVLLAAIVRTGDQVMLSSAGQLGADLSAPSALSWYDADHLLVVNQSAAGPQLEEVPVDGDRSSNQGIEPDMMSIAAAGPHNSLFAGLQTGYLAKSVGLGELWSTFLVGRDATYPG